MGEPRPLPPGATLYFRDYDGCHGPQWWLRAIATEAEELVWDNPFARLPAINTDNWGPENWGPQLEGVSASGQTLVAQVCERGACMAFDRVDEDALEAVWGSLDGGETWERWGDYPEGGVWNVSETDIAFRDTDGRVKGLRSGGEWVPPEDPPSPWVRSSVDGRLGDDEREPGQLDLFLHYSAQDAFMGAYSWGGEGSYESHRPLWLVDHLQGQLFVGFLGSQACGDGTKTVLVDFSSGTVHTVPGLDSGAGRGRSHILHRALLTQPPTPSPTPAEPVEPATTFRYDTYDLTGAVETAGSYAFLADADDPSSVVTTYEGLRGGTVTALLIHTSDADGVSRANVYDTVKAGDLFEWRQADDCFVRYKVTEVKPDPSGTAPRRLLAVEWMLYAFTGCYGRVTPDTGIQIIWDELPDVGGDSLKAPVIVGVHQLVPRGWTGAVKEPDYHWPSDYSDLVSLTNPSTEELRALDLWREPNLPDDWSLLEASSGTVNDPSFGFTALFSPPDGGIGLELIGYFLAYRNSKVDAGLAAEGLVTEARVIAGRPALLEYSPPGDHYDLYHPTTVHIVDRATETGYTLRVFADDVLDAIELAASLFENDGE